MKEFSDQWRTSASSSVSSVAWAGCRCASCPEMSGISNPYLSQIERGLRRPSAEILQQIARALSLSVESLYVRAGILEPSTEAGGADRRDPPRPLARRRAEATLVHIYESFRAEHLDQESEADRRRWA